MSAGNLAKLEALSEKRADKSQLAVEQQRSELAMIDRQHSELRTINREYQNSVVGQDSIAPQLLAHRRAFVEQLSHKLDELSVQRQQQSQILSGKLKEHRKHSAQSAAIGAMAERQVRDEKLQSLKREQRQQDETLQSRIRHDVVKGDDDNA